MRFEAAQLQLLSFEKLMRHSPRKMAYARPHATTWLYEMEGSKGLRSQTAQGRPCKLSVAELQALEDILLAGAVAFGFPNELWTLARIATVIRRTFHKRYH